jgi:hypothetical protein
MMLDRTIVVGNAAAMLSTISFMPQAVKINSDPKYEQHFRRNVLRYGIGFHSLDSIWLDALKMANRRLEQHLTAAIRLYFNDEAVAEGQKGESG